LPHQSTLTNGVKLSSFYTKSKIWSGKVEINVLINIT
jgi:hypothetical protein